MKSWRKPVRIAVYALALLAGPTSEAGDMATEVLSVGYRDPRELLEVLRPLVPPPGSVSAFNDQLIVRTDPRNLEAIRGLLLELDRPPANLLISVRHTLDEEVRRDLLAVRARATGGASVISGRAGNRISTGSAREVQRIRVLEGREAFIHDGQEIPVSERTVIINPSSTVTQDSVRYQRFTSGFLVRPRLNGNRVSLEILGNRAEPSRRGAASSPRIEVSEVQTTVTGELGRWMELAGSGSIESTTSSSIGTSRSTGTRREHGVFVKVDRLPR